MNPIKKLVLNASKKARQSRAEVFRRYFQLGESTKILDLGSEDGSNIASILENAGVQPSNVYIADIDAELIERGRKNYSFNPVLLDETGSLPFGDGFFDVVYCSSVIEHVTVPKELVWNGAADFEAIAEKRQRSFADEIKRVGRGYFVQTPARSFPIESHSWLPFIGYLPHKAQIPALKLTNRIWIKKTMPDFRLLNGKEMSELFPDAEIVSENKFGLVKSIMAIKRPAS